MAPRHIRLMTIVYMEGGDPTQPKSPMRLLAPSTLVLASHKSVSLSEALCTVENRRGCAMLLSSTGTVNSDERPSGHQYRGFTMLESGTHEVRSSRTRTAG